MDLNVNTSLKQPGTLYEVKLSETFPPQAFAGRQICFAAPVTVAFTYSFDGEALVLNGQLQAAWHANCAGCDEPFTETMAFPFAERFVKGTAAINTQNAKDEGIYRFDGERIDLSDMVLDNIFLHMPIRSLCREDCKGLCLQCGCNLNTAQCGCVHEREEQGKSPLAALGQLLNDDKEV